jgi:hypothetical protein
MLAAVEDDGILRDRAFWWAITGLFVGSIGFGFIAPHISRWVDDAGTPNWNAIAALGQVGGAAVSAGVAVLTFATARAALTTVREMRRQRYALLAPALLIESVTTRDEMVDGMFAFRIVVRNSGAGPALNTLARLGGIDLLFASAARRAEFALVGNLQPGESGQGDMVLMTPNAAPEWMLAVVRYRDVYGQFLQVMAECRWNGQGFEVGLLQFGIKNEDNDMYRLID